MPGMPGSTAQARDGVYSGVLDLASPSDARLDFALSQGAKKLRVEVEFTVVRGNGPASARRPLRDRCRLCGPRGRIRSRAPDRFFGLGFWRDVHCGVGRYDRSLPSDLAHFIGREFYSRHNH